MSADRCNGCGLDYLEVALGEPCPCPVPVPILRRPKYRFKLVRWSPPGRCLDCGGSLCAEWRGRPPKRCPECSPHRRAYARDAMAAAT